MKSKAKRSSGLQLPKELQDPRNLELIRHLRADPRIAISALARKVKMSAPAVKERVQRLEEAGIIQGYRLELDPAALGLPVTALVRVRPMPGQLPRIAKLAQSLPQVTECHRITGEDCFLVKLHLESLDGLDRLLDRFLVFGQTTTSILQSSPVPSRGPPLPDER
ncbi:MAG TPA: Lrp/AsnC family transcriptional regulator [Hypericibacter adhaerens]|uniref:Lrp/AsnC family transcriptional regulator n=1 Tax=Hypericibacter adhaerens TaxID=2602016 RepID=UPI002BD601F7|nr:Lrp/AsnC family transcriptional regulator [Hypericibacter adhaerens]HWA42355.1 Lrp/AsnC family transcriptional regulator [Hypericibacter adhaerens]